MRPHSPAPFTQTYCVATVVTPAPWRPYPRPNTNTRLPRIEMNTLMATLREGVTLSCWASKPGCGIKEQGQEGQEDNETR
eukprot:1157864-Pelagomonas_calceolata.AAC.7